jgi:transposase
VGSRCKGCGGEEQVKNGSMRGRQRHRCKGCGLSFTDTPPRGMPLQVKATAILLYVSGLSMNRTAKRLGVSTPSVQAWIERFAQSHAPKPEPRGRAVVIELDEMGRYLKKRPTSSGPGRLGIVPQGSWCKGRLESPQKCRGEIPQVAGPVLSRDQRRAAPFLGGRPRRRGGGGGVIAARVRVCAGIRSAWARRR